MNFDVNKFNEELNFDKLVEEKLGSHVYVLTDPTDQTKGNQPFYIGKGGGSGKGNNRIVSHFIEARKSFETGSANPKLQRIHAIWRKGSEVDWFAFKCEEADTTSHVAEIVESSLIQYSNLFSDDALTNKNEGNSKKFLNRQDVLALAAKCVNLNDLQEGYINRPIILFPIAKGFEKTNDYNEALIRAWKVSPDNRKLKNTIAIGLIDGISFCGIGINGWRKCDEANYKGARYEIIPEMGPTDMLLYKDFRKILEPVFGFWQRGTGGGGIIIKVEQDGRIEFIRGLNKKFKDNIYYI